jgi:hypothetical protein
MGAKVSAKREGLLVRLGGQADNAARIGMIESLLLIERMRRSITSTVFANEIS